MNFRWINRVVKRRRALMALSAGLFLANGCVIDTDNFLTDVFDAMLQSTSASLVESLADYLARH